MSAWGAMGPGTRVLIVALGGALAIGVGYLGWQASRSADRVVGGNVAPELTPAAEPNAEAAAAQGPEPTPKPLPEAVAAPAPNLPKVEVIVDDAPVAGGVAQPSGEFVVQFTLAPNPDPSLLWLTMTPPDGAAIVSPEMVALAPIKGPKLVAVQPEPAPDATVAPAPTPEAAKDKAPAALLVTEEGAVVLQDDAPADPAFASQVMIDTIAYSPAGEVQVGGRGAGGAVLRLYLDNAEAANATVQPGGRWLVTLGDTAPGIYMLRVDQLDASGKVTARFETPFKRETLEALAMAADAKGDAPQAGAPQDMAEAPPEPSPGPTPGTDPAADADLGPTPEPPVEPSIDKATGAAPKAVLDPAPEIAAPGQAADPAAGKAVVTQEASVVPSEPARTEDQAAVEPVAAAEPAPGPAQAVSITVQPGFTLWGIAQERLGDGVLYVQVFEANREKIRNPDLIYPGQVFSIPAAAP
mgnify:CR=1 FL=1